MRSIGSCCCLKTASLPASQCLLCVCIQTLTFQNCSDICAVLSTGYLMRTPSLATGYTPEVREKYNRTWVGNMHLPVKTRQESDSHAHSKSLYTLVAFKYGKLMYPYVNSGHVRPPNPPPPPSTLTSSYRAASASSTSVAAAGTSPRAQDSTSPRVSMSSARRVGTGGGRLERDPFSVGALATDVRHLS